MRYLVILRIPKNSQKKFEQAGWVCLSEQNEKTVVVGWKKEKEETRLP